MPKPQRISDAKAMQIYFSILDAIGKTATAPDPDTQKQMQQFLVEFSKKVNPGTFAGVMPIEAYNAIIKAAQEASDEVKNEYEKNNVYTVKPEDYDKDRDDTVAAIRHAASLVAFKAGTTAVGVSGAQQLVNAAVSSVRTRSDNTTAVDHFLRYFYSQLPANLDLLSPSDANQAVEIAARDAMNRVHGYKEFLVRPPPAQGLQLSTQAQTIGAVAAAALQAVNETASKIIPAPANPVAPKAPEDVSCSMSVLSWKETSDTFGRRVANTYVAVQVNVRNLNTKNEFLIHDIQVAIDTGIPESLIPDEDRVQTQAPGPNPQEGKGQPQVVNQNKNLGRFQAGRDKLLVRAVAQRGQSDDARNLAVNALEMIGAVAGASSVGVTGGDFKTAVAVFQGAFIPGFTRLFPDHTVDQLNHINDLAFSASSTSKVLVPIQGSVPLVTFIAEKPVEELPFAWCGHKKSDGHAGENACNIDSSSPGSVAKDPRELPFGQWKPLALEILQNRTFVVIGGVHIQEVQGTAKIANLEFATFPSGEVDVSQTQNGVVIGTVTGSSLDKVSSVALEKGAEKIAGKIKAAADGNSAVLQFDPSKLCSGDGTYHLYLLDSSGTETDSGQLVMLKAQPYVSSIKGDAADGTLDITKAALALTLNGARLELVKGISLVDPSGVQIHATLPSSVPNATSIQPTFSAGAFGTTAGKTYHLKYSFWAPPTEVDAKSLTVTTSGTPSPAIDTVSPASAKTGVTVTVTGTNFGSAQGSVSFNGKRGVIADWTSTIIKVKVPVGATSGPLIVTTAANISSNAQQFIVAP